MNMQEPNERELALIETHAQQIQSTSQIYGLELPLLYA